MKVIILSVAFLVVATLAPSTLARPVGFAGLEDCRQHYENKTDAAMCDAHQGPGCAYVILRPTTPPFTRSVGGPVTTPEEGVDTPGISTSTPPVDQTIPGRSVTTPGGSVDVPSVTHHVDDVLVPGPDGDIVVPVGGDYGFPGASIPYDPRTVGVPDTPVGVPSVPVDVPSMHVPVPATTVPIPRETVGLPSQHYEEREFVCPS